MEFFSSAIEKYTAHLLSAISTDYGLNLDELKAKYIGVKVVKAKAPKVPMADRPMCSGTVGKKKEPCKNKARAGETTCHIHGEKPPVDVCQPCKVPQVPAPAPVPVEASLIDSVKNLANIAAEVSEEIKVKKPKKKKVLEVPQVPVPPPADLVEEPEEPEEVPEPEVIDDLSARLQAMLQSGAAFDDDEDEDEDEEPESPGTQRHKEILGAKGVAWEEYYGDDDEDEELLEEDEEELEED
jgi:hypothetical protein